MVEQTSSNGAPLWPGPTDVSARLDRLEKRLGELEGLRPAVESALVAQAGRIESMLAGARRDIGEAATVDDRVRSVVAGLSADAEDRHDALLSAVGATREPVESLAAAVDALHVEVAGLRGQATDADEVDAARAALEEAITAGVDAVRRAGEAAVAAVSTRLDTAVERMGELLARVGALEDALTHHLDELDRRQADERARLTQAFAEQFADGLSRRDRRRLARRLEVPEPAAGTAVAPAAGRVVSSPTTVPATTPVRAGRPPAAVDDGQDVQADDVPAPDVAGPPAPVRPSRRDRPVRPTASDPTDPAAVRRALATVRGLGPARQSALIDHFGTLEAIRDASDDDLLAVHGIGPALLPGIRDATA